MPTFGSETYRSTSPLEVIRPRETTPYFIPPEAIIGPDAIPILESIAPPKLKAGPGQPDRNININGFQLLPSTVVVWGGVDMTPTYVSNTLLRLDLKPSTVTPPLVVPVYLRNNRTLSNQFTFTFTA
jgi:hypothetical protein